MAFELVPVQASEQSDLIQFLLKSYQADPALSSFRPDVIHWKYFAPHPEWDGPRSWAVKQEGRIVAHGGVWPIRLVTPNAVVNAIHLIDWAASRSAVGAGVFLLKKIAGLADVLLTIGGSQDTRNLLPRLGYKQHGELRQYARVIRPWLHFRTTPGKSWKSCVKLLRNSARTVTGIRRAPHGWQAAKITSFSGAMQSTPTRNLTSSLRTAAGLNHLLNCPAAKFSAFQVNQGQRLRGYFILAKVGRQARIVDIRMQSDDRVSWQAATELAVRTAAQDPDICEITAASSAQLSQDACLRAGLVRRQTDQIFCYDPRGLAVAGPPFDLSLADGDLCFLTDPLFPYLL